MLSAYRNNILIRTLILTAMVWGFAVPVVHLACGMAAEAEAIVCDDHEMGAAMHDSAATVAGMEINETVETGKAGETGDSGIECCWIDADAADLRAPLPSLNQLPDFTATASELFATRDVTEACTRGRTNDAESPPPVSFRLLFSVFLI